MIECKTSKEIIFIGNNINPSLTIDGGRILGLKGIYVISENCTVEVNGGYIQPTIYGDDITVTINGVFWEQVYLPISLAAPPLVS